MTAGDALSGTSQDWMRFGVCDLATLASERQSADVGFCMEEVCTVIRLQGMHAPILHFFFAWPATAIPLRFFSDRSL
jgi:hypothetical protein